MSLLRPHQTLSTLSGRSLEVLECIGAGGQGEVYRVKLDGRFYALKWYTPPATDAQRDWAAAQQAGLRDYLLRVTPPDPRFLWPHDAVLDPRGRTFGYVMDLLEPRFKGLEALVLGRMRPVPRLTTLCGSAIALAECFRKLHNAGACYKDINLGGPLLDPVSGEIRICDVDNVRVNKTPGDILFVFFAAPELISGQGSCQTSTDIHSLAVLLFYMFVRHHPLDGKRELEINVFNEAAQRQFYGTDPRFIFDPDDDSNGPAPGYHDQAVRNWGRYPRFLRDAWTRAFTVGLHAPGRRVREGEWMSLFSRLRDLHTYCPSCGVENFVEPQGTSGCAQCGCEIPPPPRLQIGSHTVLLAHDTELFAHHLGAGLSFGPPVARVVAHPRDPQRWGLKNLGTHSWQFTDRDGHTHSVAPDRSVALRDALEIDLGPARLVAHFSPRNTQ